MGAQVAWVAVRGKDRDAVLREMRLRGTGRSDPDAEADVCGLQLAKGWYLVHMRDWAGTVDAGFFEDDRGVRGLSRGAEAVFCDVSEHIMYSEASHWRDGVQVWRVEHDGAGAHAEFLGKEGVGGPRHLDVAGTPPAGFEGIRDRRFAEQDAGDREGDGVDYVFEIPSELGALITGFRHDFDKSEPFEVLESIGGPVPMHEPGRRGCMLALPAALFLVFERVFARRGRG